MLSICNTVILAGKGPYTATELENTSLGKCPNALHCLMIALVPSTFTCTGVSAFSVHSPLRGGNILRGPSSSCDVYFRVTYRLRLTWRRSNTIIRPVATSESSPFHFGLSKKWFYEDIVPVIPTRSLLLHLNSARLPNGRCWRHIIKHSKALLHWHFRETPTNCSTSNWGGELTNHYSTSRLNSFSGLKIWKLDIVEDSLVQRKW